MELDKVTEIHKVYDDDEANAFFKKKYKLIRILQTKSILDQMEVIRPCFVIGKICE